MVVLLRQPAGYGGAELESSEETRRVKRVTVLYMHIVYIYVTANRYWYERCTYGGGLAS